MMSTKTQSTGVSCVIDGEEIVFCSDVGVLLSLVDTQDAVSEIVKEVCLNHHTRFGYGTDYLMLFIHYLKISTLNLLDQGVPVHYIIEYMREAMDLCIANIDKWSIPIDIQAFDTLDQRDGSHFGSSTTMKAFGSELSNSGTTCSELDSAKTSCSESNSSRTSCSDFSNSARPSCSESSSGRQETLCSESVHLDVNQWADKCQLNGGSKTKSENLQVDQNPEAKCPKINSKSLKYLDSDEHKMNFGELDWNNDFQEVVFKNPVGACDMLPKNTAVTSFGNIDMTNQSLSASVDCEPIFLKMAGKDQTCGESDDVSWFFEDSNDPKNGVIRNETQFPEFHDLMDHKNSVTQKEASFLEVNAPNLCDDISRTISDQHHHLPSASEVKSKSQKDTKKDNSQIENLEDEFDSIFDSCEFPSMKTGNTPNKNSKSLKIDKNFKYFDALLQRLSGPIKKQHSIKSSNILSRHMTNSKSSEIPDFESQEKLTNKWSNRIVEHNSDSDTEKRNRINAILENFSSKVSPKTLALKVLNSSRHFKTFSTTTLEPQDTLEDDGSFSVEPSCSAKNLSNAPTVPRTKLVSSPNLSSVQNNGFLSNSMVTPGSSLIKNNVINSNMVTQNSMVTQNRVTRQTPVTTQNSMTNQNSMITQNTWITQNSSQKTHIRKMKAKKKSPFLIDSKTEKNLNLKDVCAGLHGDEMIKEIVLDSFRSQVTSDSPEVLRFDTRRIHSVIDVGPSPHFTRLISGLVLNCSTDCVIMLRQFERINAILLNGDLTSSFHHKGYKANYKGIRMSQSVAMETEEDKWISQLLLILLKLKVNTVLVKGHTNCKVRDSLEANSIVIIESVPFKIIEVLSDTTQTVPLIYPLDAFQDNVCKDIRIMEYNDNCLYTRSETTTSRCIIQHKHSLLQTVIICHPCQLGAEVLLQDFWQCANQFKDAIADGMVLPGAGVVEEWCSHLLHKSTQTAYESLHTSMEDKAIFKPLVFEELGNLFQNVQTQLKQKYEVGIQDFDSSWKECLPKSIYDNFICKVQTWKKAFETVVDILRTDCIITTGTEENEFCTNSYTFKNKSFI